MSAEQTQSKSGNNGAPSTQPPTDSMTSVVPSKPRGLTMKLVEVLACVDRVAKNGTNAAQGYKYAMAADVYDAVRSELAKRFVLPVPHMESIEFADVATKSGGVLKLCSWLGHIDFTDAETGEVLSVKAFGQGSDSGDKSAYKAVTGATKQCLVQLFLIPTGDDPENEKAAAKAPPPAGAEALKARMKAATAPAPRADEPPPPTDDDAPPDAAPSRPGVFQTAPPTHDRAASFGFGSSKGVSLADLDANSLAWYVKCLNRDLADVTKAQWHEKTRAQLSNLLAEQRYRGAA